MAAPIVVDGAIWGEFYATRLRGRRVFDSGDVAYVEVLMTILGGAISSALRDERTAEAAPAT
jgi:GAF domain-containing protein